MAAKKNKAVRIDEQLWEDAKVAAAAEGLTITDVVTSALEVLVRHVRERSEADASAE
ncbi:hypothetical protein [Sinomonas sp. RB5]